MGTDHIEPFELRITDAEITDLRNRLANTRWADPETVEDWSQGTPLAYVKELCEHWAAAYDFAAAEARFNAFPQFRTAIDGLGIHFLHARSPHDDALPLVMTHGWPGSVVEFHEVIGPLVDPTAHGGEASDAFHVVCPSLPGFGWSDKPTEAGWGIERIAAAWAELMGRLGYERYGAQGGDWGAGVTGVLGPLDREHCIGIHLNMVLAFPDPDTMADLTAGGAGLHRLVRVLRPVGLGLLEAAVHPPAERRLRVGRLAGRTAAPGSSRSCTPGRTATVTRRTCSPAIACSTT